MLEMLNNVFGSFDSSIINAFISLANGSGSFFTPLFKVISLLGEKGLIFFVASIILMLFSKTRKAGICIFGAVACGALITNIILKDAIARPRPCQSNFMNEWLSLGFPAEDGYSFPSGHMTAISSAMFAVLFSFKKKFSWIGLPFIILMGISRIYLLAHYPTDVIAGIIVGVVSATIAFFITKLIYNILLKNSNNKFCDFVLYKGLHFQAKKQDNQQDNQ